MFAIGNQKLRWNRAGIDESEGRVSTEAASTRMKIARLDLKAFGPFTDEVLDLSAGQCGLHLIYGPNEAGKSSALRALHQLLYGILPRTTDAFEHSYGNLRVGGLLTNGEGSRLEIIRRKANKNDLRGADDESVVEPGTLAQYLGRLDREQFETMFGIDHATLVRGGREIVEGKGSLGQVLFAAGSGIADLKGVQEQLDKEAGVLFNPAAQAKNPIINARLSAWEMARKTVTAAQLPSAEWERHDKALAQAQKALAETENELSQARVEHARLERIHQAVPLVARLRANAAHTAELGPTPVLTENFGERRLAVVTQLTVADTAAQAAAEGMAKIDEQIAELGGGNRDGKLLGEAPVAGTPGRRQKVPAPYSAARQKTFVLVGASDDAYATRTAAPVLQQESPAARFDRLLARNEAIEQLAKDLGSYRKAQLDLRETIKPRLDQAETAARRLLKQLRPDLTLSDVETLRIARHQAVEIQNLGGKYEALHSQHRQATDHVASLVERLAAARDALAKLPPPRNADLLKSVLRRAANVSRVEEERAAASVELAALESQASALLARLPLWQGTLAALEQLAVPASETIDAHETRLAEAERVLARLNEELTGLENEQTRLDQQLDEDSRAGEPPSEAALAEARRRRDEGWRIIRSAWLDGDIDPAEVRLFTAGDGTTAELAGAFEGAVDLADKTADQLRRDADRVATRAAQFVRRQNCLDQTAKLAAQREAAVCDRDARLNEWQSLWRPLGIEPLTPREMRAWERKLQALLRQAEVIRRQQSAVDTFDTRIANCRRELNRALDVLGEPTTQSGETLAAQLERAQLLADAIDAAAASHARLTDEAAGLDRQLESERAKAAAAERELSSWKSRWSAAMAPLGLSADATPAQANEILAQLETLFRHLAEAEGLRERIDGIACEADQFAEETRLLLENLDRGDLLDGKTADQAADALLLEYRQATEDRGRLQTLRKQREGQARQLAESKRAAAEARAVLDALCREAGCDDPAHLPELEERSLRAKELQANERNLHEQLSLLSAGMPLNEFMDEVGRVDGDDLPDRLDRFGRRVSELETQRVASLNTITLETKALADMDAGSAAADAEEDAQGLAAQIAGDVETYVRLRLASAVLRAAIERYREKNQGPVLERASQLFAELTVGSFAGLRADYNEQGDAVLMGVRATDGRTVSVDGMSDGTADQLYLALRLASLENYLAEHEPAPLVVDDILINFDNRRSLATLRVLAELSRRTQVIFLTHHEHLVAMAREHFDEQTLFVHRLGRATAMEPLAGTARIFSR